MFLMKFAFFLGLGFALLGVLIMKLELPRVYQRLSTLLTEIDDSDERVSVWTLSKDINRLFLERNIIKYLNYRECNRPWDGKWNILWSVEYPFHRVKQHIRNLQPHQRINHFPGMSSLTIKKYLATRFSQYNFIPRGFIFPNMKNDFQALVKQKPDGKFVEKNWKNRGVKLVQNINEINFESFSMREKFLQEFVEHPYLIDNRVFDIGIYVLITSFDPLRVYKFDKEILLRFCSENYHPFNGENTKQYVVDDDSVYVWDIKSLKDYVLKLNYTAKASLELHIMKNGHDVTKVWEQMNDAITKLLLDNEKDIISESRIFGRPSVNFFELLRFDFILDENLNVHLMEINMSPHLSTSKDFANIKLIYRSQLLHDVFSIVAGKELLKTSENDFILSDERDVTIPLSVCNETESCMMNESMECGMCMTEIQAQIVHRSYREHVRRGGRMKRIFPAIKHYNDSDLLARASTVNKFSINWFHSMCKINKDWC